VSPDSQRRFVGFSYAEALARELPPVQELVEGLIEAGTVGTLAGLPETHKSFLAVEVANKVAAGIGTVLGRDVVGSGPVGYWWQDDSEAKELARIKDYAARHGFGDEPVRWYLNAGMRLPSDIDELRAEVEREQQTLVVLDSLYNFLSGVGMKDEEAADVLARLKAEVCDPTGVTVLIVDHTPWPSEANRGQRRAYGSVFKAAAIRWGVYLDREGAQLHVAASGNNITGFARTQALFDSETLQVRLREQNAPPPSGPDLATRIAELLAANEGSLTTQEVIRGTGKRAQDVSRELHANPRFVEVERRKGTNSRAHCWGLADEFIPSARTISDEPPLAQPGGSSSHDLPTPVGGEAQDGLTEGARPDDRDGLDGLNGSASPPSRNGTQAAT
jgi:hypothetical protein